MGGQYLDRREFLFPARGEMPSVKLVRYDGGKRPPRPEELEADRRWPKRGALYIGDQGTNLDATEKCESPRIIPESKMREFLPKRPPKTIPRVLKGNPHSEWILACKGGPQPGSCFDYAGPLAETVLLGNVAIRSRKKIEWDPEKLTCPNAPEADRFVRIRYRVF